MSPLPSNDASARTSSAHSSDTAEATLAESPTGALSHTGGSGPLTPLPELRLGSLVAGRYELRQLLGAGGYGQVYRAWDIVRRQHVALKVLRDDSTEALLQFKQEFRALAELRHRNLIRFMKLGRTESDLWFLVMELIEGDTLTATSSAGSPPTSQRAIALESTRNNPPALAPTGQVDECVDAQPRVYQHEISPLFEPQVISSRMAQIAAGLRVLHGAGVIHCDLKPSNVLISEKGRVVILDFGVARYTRHLGAHHQAPRMNAGTRPYMSPEFRAGHEPHPGVDWYATGMMLAELLTGLSASHLGAHSRDESVQLFRDAADEHPAYRSLYELAEGLLHPDHEARFSDLDVQRICGDAAMEPQPFHEELDFPFLRSERELEHLLHLWQKYRSQQPALVIVEGPAGIGKTALCREFVQRVMSAEEAPIVLMARCRTDELLGYRAFDELVDGVASVLQQLSEDELQPLKAHIGFSLAELFPTLKSFRSERCAGDTQPVPEHALRDLHALLQGLTASRDVIIWVEDIHLADDDSLRWFAQIFAPGQTPRAMLLLTRRPNENARLTDHFDIDTLGYAIPIFRLAPLDDDSAEQSVRRWLPDDIDNREEVIRHLTRFGRGHPYLLRELCRDTELAKSMTSSTTLARLLRTRLERLSRLEHVVLVSLAASSLPLSRTQLAAVANISLEDLDDALDRLESESLVWQVSSPNHREEVYEVSQRSIIDTALHQLEPTMLAQVHHRHAQLGVEGVIESMPAATIVSHLVRSGSLHEAQAYAEKTASNAIARGAWSIGAQMFDILLQIARDSAEKPSTELRKRAVESRLRTGRGVDASRLLLELAAETTDSEARSLRRRAAEALILSGHVAEGLRINQSAMPPGMKAPTTFVPSLIQLMRIDQDIHKRLSNFDVESTIIDDPINETHTAQLDTFRMLGVDLGLVDAVQAYHFTIRELQTALESRSLNEILRALAGYCAFTNMAGGKVEIRVRRYLELGRNLARRAGDETLLHWLSICEGAVDYHNGAYRDGWERIRTSYDWMHQNASDQQMMLGYLHQHRIFCSLMFCDTDGLRKTYYQQLVNARAHHNRLLETSMTLIGFQTWLIDDVPDAAAAALERVHWRGPTKGFQFYDYLRLRAQSELVLYRNDIGPDLDYLIDRWARFEATLVARTVRLCRDEGRYIHARLILARAKRDGRLSTRDRLILLYVSRDLRKQNRALTKGWGELLGANLAYADRNFVRARQHLVDAETIFEDAGLSYYSGIARIAAHVAKLSIYRDCPISALRAKGVIAPERVAHQNSPILC